MKEIVVNISLDGNMWCALIGKNLQEGIAGFGTNPEEAFKDLAESIMKEGWFLLGAV